MFRESSFIVQVRGEPRRRWFMDGDYDLIVWVDHVERPIGFQLIYPRLEGLRAFTCTPSGRLSHARVNDGSVWGQGYNMSALVERDDRVPIAPVLVDFLRRSRRLEDEVVYLVATKMRAYGAG